MAGVAGVAGVGWAHVGLIRQGCRDCPWNVVSLRDLCFCTGGPGPLSMFQVSSSETPPASRYCRPRSGGAVGIVGKTLSCALGIVLGQVDRAQPRLDLWAQRATKGHKKVQRAWWTRVEPAGNFFCV